MNLNTTSFYFDHRAAQPIHAVPKRISCIKGKWIEGTYSLKIDIEHIRTLQAKLKTAKGTIRCPVEWEFPILYKEKLQRLFNHYPPSVGVTIKKEAGSFKVLLQSKELRQEAEELFYKLNQECFTYDDWRLRLHVNWCNEEQDREERQRFLLDIVLRSKDNASNRIAAANALTILRAADFSFSGLNLQGIYAPYADLRGSILENVNMRNAHLEYGNFTNASLKGGNLEGCHLENIRLGQKPSLKHAGVELFVVSNNELFAVSVSQDFIHIWDLPTSQCIKTISTDLLSNCLNATFCDQQQILLTGHHNGRINVWPYPHFVNPIDIQIHDKNLSLFEISPYYPKVLLSVADKDENSKYEFKLWQITSSDDERYLVPIAEGVLSHLPGKICWSPCKAYFALLASLDDKTNEISVFSYDLKKVGNSLTIELPVHDMQFSSDGELLVSILSGDFGFNVEHQNFSFKSTVVAYSVEGNKVRELFTEESRVLRNIEFIESSVIAYICGPGFPLLGVIGNAKFCLRDLNKNQLLYKGTIFEGNMKNFHFSYSQGLLFAQLPDEVAIFNLQDFLAKQMDQFKFSISDACFSKDNRLLTISKESILREYNPHNGRCMTTRKVEGLWWENALTLTGNQWNINFHSHSFSFAPSVNYLVTDRKVFLQQDDKKTDFHDFKDRIRLVSIKKDTNNIVLDLVCDPLCAAYTISPEGDYLACFFLEGDREIEIWNVLESRSIGYLPRSLPTQTSNRFALALPRAFVDAAPLAFANDRELFLWRLQIKIEKDIPLIHAFSSPIKLNIRQKEKEVPQLFFGKDDRFLIALYSSQILVWNLPGLSLTKLYKNPKRKIYLESYDVSGDRSLIAACYTNQQACKIHLWNIETKQRIIQLKMAPLNRFFSGAKLLLSSDKKYLALWNVSHVYMWEVKGLSLQMLWQVPQTLQAENLDIQGAFLEAEAKVLLTQLGAEEEYIEESSTKQNILQQAYQKSVAFLSGIWPKKKDSS
ncbi:pentapeptide repeat-containing protein [Neochlamydia sp. S13]|uniref:pentapeptide repeat-containing protein n=1 Tax=Neochlamydia sp. S13 TaxID=1353976 RepID=UPI00069453BB|nr:pentapeptide repeat-containing protein [Neochlamydia sp. S13]BBI17722.1 hypothetical protein NCS13_1_1527 [Neochlamydia sp. S13]